MLPAYILSGGQSRRFGSDKSRHEIEGQPQLLRLKQQLSECGHEVHVVADRADRYIDLGITSLVDEVPGAGPLAGLATALAHRLDNATNNSTLESHWLLLVSCDQLHWTNDWYLTLITAITFQSQAIAYFDNRWHPLPGLYHTSLLPDVRARLQQPQLSLQSMLSAAQSIKLHTTAPPSQHSFNTQAEL